MRPSLRALCFLVLLVALCGLFVWHGTLSPDPADNRFPGSGQLVGGELAPGDRIVIAGTVVTAGSDHGTIALDGDPDVIVDVGPLGEDASPGDAVWMHATLREDAGADSRSDAAFTVDTHRAIVRAPWEIAYMYVVSFLAGLWVLARFASGWHVSRAELALVPNAHRTDGTVADGGERHG